MGWHDMALQSEHSMAQHGMAWHGVAWRGMAWHGAVEALAAVSWPLSAAYSTNVTAVTTSGVAVKMNMKSEE